MKNKLVPNVNRAEVKKPWSRGPETKSESQTGFGITKERGRRDGQGQNLQRTVHPKGELYHDLQMGAAAIDQLNQVSVTAGFPVVNCAYSLVCL